MLGLVPALSFLIGTASAALASAAATTSVAEIVGAGTATVYDMYKTLINKEYFSTEEAMILLRLSKPTILRKFKEWENDHNSKEGLAHEGQGGRSGFRVKRKDIENYAVNHGIALDWDKLVELYLDEKQRYEAVRNGIPQDKQIQQKIEMNKILIKRNELEIEGLELDLEDEQDPVKKRELRRKIIEVKKRINNIEGDSKMLEFSLDKVMKAPNIDDDF